MPVSSKRTAASLDDSEVSRRVKFRSGFVEQRPQADSFVAPERNSDDRSASQSEDEEVVEREREQALKVRDKLAWESRSVLWINPNTLLDQ